MRGFLFVLICLAVLGFVAQQVNPQTSEATAQARQHYQNAVSAINKGDWQAAKNELLQAEKLAPHNALVHYDLALAYSHTGQVKSAQLELNKALQLGLPAEQKQAAQELNQKLASQGTVPKANGASNAMSSPQSPPSKAPVIREPATPTIEETIEYLNKMVGTNSGPVAQDSFPGKIMFDKKKAMIWYSRWSPGDGVWAMAKCRPNGYENFCGYYVYDLDLASLRIDNFRGTNEPMLFCLKHDACGQSWGRCSRTNNAVEGVGALTAIDEVPTDATLAHNVGVFQIDIKGGTAEVERGTRALLHLIRLVQSSPKPKDSNDPFAQ
jgi:hypothetical protein